MKVREQPRDKTIPIMDASICAGPEAGWEIKGGRRGTERGKGKDKQKLRKRKNGAVIPNKPRGMTAKKVGDKTGGGDKRKEFCGGGERACSAIWIHSPGLVKTERTLHQHLDCCRYR